MNLTEVIHRGSRDADNMSARPFVSVIIPTYNSAQTISACLCSVRSQSYAPIQIVVVDRHSQDGTVSVAAQHVDVLLQDAARRSAARNLGASLSKGEYLLFLDSDMELERHVVEECVALCESRGYDGVVVPEVSFGTGYWANCIALETQVYLGNSLIEAPCFFRKQSFLALKGYDEYLEAGEDWDIYLALAELGHTVGRAVSSIRHNVQRATPKVQFLKKYTYGKTIDRYVRKNSTVARAQLSPRRFLTRKAMGTLVRSPKYGVGLTILKLIEFIALGLGRRFRKTYERQAFTRLAGCSTADGFRTQRKGFHARVQDKTAQEYECQRLRTVRLYSRLTAVASCREENSCCGTKT